MAQHDRIRPRDSKSRSTTDAGPGARLRVPLAGSVPTAKLQPLMEPGRVVLRTRCQTYLQEDS